MTAMRVLRLWAVLLCLALPAFSPAFADDIAAPNYTQWEKEATAAEKVVSDNAASDTRLNDLRASMVEWRTSFNEATGINADQIATVKNQIAALGPVPTDGTAEDPAIAQRRQTLTDSLTKLQAPGLAATEAASRADGVVRNIDKILRERQADKMLRLSPSALNPANWAPAWSVLHWMSLWIYDETQRRFAQTSNYDTLRDNAPLIAVLVLVSFILIARGSRWMARLSKWLLGKTEMRGRDLVAAIVSVGQVVLPVIGAVLLTQALRLTTLFGPIVTSFFAEVPLLLLAALGMWWLGARIFPADPKVPSALGFAGEHRAEGQIHSATMGIALALEYLVLHWIAPRAEDYLGGAGFLASDKARAIAEQAQEAMSVLQGPLLILAGLSLFRMGQLIRHNLAVIEARDDEAQFQYKLVRWVANAIILIGVAGPVMGLIGYVAAANALLWPTIVTLGVIALVIVAQNYVAELYAVLTHSEDRIGETLLPVLVGFVLTLAALPVLALVWGARPEDLLELWAQFKDGFQLGGVKLSPGVFLTFVVVFAIGYTITRLVQGALRTSILPKTSLDRGGQNAIVSGLGYLGIFLAALLAISVAGINLSSLAIVAGALSVGVGFGLQTIVQNFVSGIILLIERPISEGDWIKVGSDQGIVKAISVRSTRIETFDKSEVVIPNATLITGQVTNLTRTNRTGRVIVKVGVAYGTDTRKVAKLLQEIAENHPLVMMNPAPAVLFTGFGADSMDFEIRAILSDVGFGTSVQSEMNHQIAERFAAEGIEIPFAQRDLWLRNPETLAEAISGHPAEHEVAVAPEGPAEKPRIASPSGEGLKPLDPRLRDEALDRDDDEGRLGDNDGTEEDDGR
ncbi:DUF3772 domain-containing protein [Paenirhodobacter enshiensis]|uniref:DUF3772 domain-containing protein n=1 Tax=Paenirhodobacter enshiensis TaxID=1105367 RepID=UPI00069036C5|nr:DUF3772 domain-containing protein [Paenirhodobacter enshiensis]